jgi:hypothetical protein
MSVRESSRPLGDLRMQRRYWSYWAAPESLGMDLPDRVFPANRVANIAAVDAVDIRLRRLPTSAAAEAPVSSSLGAGSGRQTGARYRPVCNHARRCGAPVPPGDQVSWRCTTLPSGPATRNRVRREKASEQFGREANPTVLTRHDWGAPSEAFLEQPRRSRLVSRISAIRHHGPPSAQRKGSSWPAWLGVVGLWSP